MEPPSPKIRANTSAISAILAPAALAIISSAMGMTVLNALYTQEPMVRAHWTNRSRSLELGDTAAVMPQMDTSCTV